MKIAAVVCEYNPFHNGHQYQLQTARERLGCDAVAGIMSGNFVQRGSAAVFPKQLRAKAALAGGMDLVLDLPAVLTLQSAERYARNAVMTLDAMGCIGTLFFGAECPETDVLINIARVLADEDNSFKAYLREGLRKGLPFAAARANSIKSILGEASAEILSRPNNILAVEYCKALIRCKSKIRPFAIARKGAGHDSPDADNGFASATEIRRMLLSGKDVSDYVTESSTEIFADKEPFSAEGMERVLIANLCMMTPDKLAQIADVSEGLEYALINAAFDAATLDGLISSVKSKRYAYSRLRRIILNAYLGITKADYELTPSYIRILDFNEQGRSILNFAKDTATLPLAKNGRQVKDNPDALALWRRELAFDRVYELFYCHNSSSNQTES